MLIFLFSSLVVSLIVGGVMLRYKHIHQNYTSDYTSGPQKNHSTKALRVGGVAIFAGWMVGLLLGYNKYGYRDYFYLIITILPVFTAGLVEDLTKKVRPRIRLLFAFFSASMGILLFNAQVNSVGLSFIDQNLLTNSIISYAITIIAISGTTHSFNIIDGHNGLSGMITILILIALSYVSYKMNDFFITSASFALIGAIAGFLFWNFPRGLIFAGDCGAYLMGFTVSQFAVLLTTRFKQISPWFAFLLLLYPVFETLFSMYRRKYIQARPIAHPDSLHLHSIIYKRLVRWVAGKAGYEDKTHGNSMTSPYLWIISLNTIIPAILFWNNTPILLLFSFQYIAVYIWLYKKIVRFQTPKFLTLYRYRNYSFTSKNKS
jgi:UDP-GlcNAc:undecaprenyl-phosphate/decaprenyl-phosphate GlcNAc-1-phosphate transferase